MRKVLRLNRRSGLCLWPSGATVLKRSIPRNRDRGLAETDPAVVGRNVVMGEHAKALFLERTHRPVKKKHILKDAAAQCHRVMSGTRVNNPARIGDHLCQRVVKTSGNGSDWNIV